MRRSSLPTISKLAASAPARVRLLVPSASSVMTISATLMALDVSVSSASDGTVLVSETVAASFTSVIFSVCSAVSSGEPGIAASSTCTVTSKLAFVSKVQGGAGLEAQLAANDLKGSGISACQGQIIGSQGIVGDHDIRDLDGGSRYRCPQLDY